MITTNNNALIQTKQKHNYKKQLYKQATNTKLQCAANAKDKMIQTKTK